MFALALLRPPVSPFDLRTVFLAKHAQHVVLIHFPIGLFVTGVVFDALGYWGKRRGLADAAYYNFTAAAMSIPLVIVSGVLAWQLQLGAQKLEGILLLHFVLACVSSSMVLLVWWLHFSVRMRAQQLRMHPFVVELFAVAGIVLTGHVGGFLTGVNIQG